MQEREREGVNKIFVITTIFCYNKTKILSQLTEMRIKMLQKEEILNYLKSHQEYYYNQFGIRFVGLFGSYAREEADEKSDIDILYKIDRDKKLSIFQYLKLNKQLEDFFRTKIDLVRDETLKPKLKQYIRKDITYV